MTLYRLHIPKQTAANGIVAGLLSIRKSVGDPFFEMRLDYTTVLPSTVGPSLTNSIRSLGLVVSQVAKFDPV
jgi:hypothetical protein